MKKKIISVDDKALHLLIGGTLAEFMEEDFYDEEGWDFPIVELLNDAIEINEDIWYWLSEDSARVYETSLSV